MLKARIHNAKACTVDGLDHWVGCFLNKDGRFVGGLDNVHSDDELQDVINWLKDTARERGHDVEVEVV